MSISAIAFAHSSQILFDTESNIDQTLNQPVFDNISATCFAQSFQKFFQLEFNIDHSISQLILNSSSVIIFIFFGEILG
jgi:hypothetical protein